MKCVNQLINGDHTVFFSDISQMSITCSCRRTGMAKAVPGYDEGLSRVQGDEWQNCGDYANLSIIAIMLSSKLCEVSNQIMRSFQT